MEGKLTGADKDINNLIFKRYSDEQISHFLNDTAQFQQIPNNENNYLADIKQIMHKDTENYLKVIASINNPARSFSPTPQNSHKEKTNSTPLLRQQRELRTNSSYPSGHTTMGWGITLVLAEINPARQDEVLKRGYEYGESRVIVGFHYQSDVDHARILTSALINRLHANDDFIKQMQKAKAEFLSKTTH